jgi:hypothetical protein
MLTEMRFLVMLSGGNGFAFPRSMRVNVGQGIAADVKELLTFSHISEKPTPDLLVVDFTVRPVQTNLQLLPFIELSWQVFERLCPRQYQSWVGRFDGSPSA